jgi:molybdopterin synthase sulfur carrier subunit
MATVRFTTALQSHVACPPGEVAGATVREALEAYFNDNPAVRSYVLDEQGGLRKHVTVFVDGEQMRNRTLTSPISENAELYVMQALSGGMA